MEEATHLSLRDSAFWPLFNIVEMVADFNCGFRAVVHIIQGQESMWPGVRQRLLDQLNSDPTGYLRGFAVTPGAEISAEPVGEPYALSCHAQLTADTYDIIIVMVTNDYSNVMI